MSGPQDAQEPSVEVADGQRMFVELARSYPELPLYRAICEAVATDDEVAGLLTAARPGQARPVLFLAALHELVLRRPDLPAARWYPSVTGEPVPDGDPWPDVRRTCLDHAEELRATIATRATQTNEVNRVVQLAPLLAQACADLPGAPVVLVEMGASAGLLLGLDRYRIEVGAADETAPPVVFGDPSSSVACAGRQRSGPSLVDLRLPTIAGRIGLDLAPVALDDEAEVRWLEACLWPDALDRLDRFRAATALLGSDPPAVVAGDMVDDLEAVAHSARAVATASASLAATSSSEAVGRAAAPEAAGDDAAGRADPGPLAIPGEAPVHLVVFSSWALTYVARARRPHVAEALASLAADGRPVSWLTAEPPGCVPGIPRPDGDPDVPPETASSTVLGARRWRDGQELPPARWGTCHPHGTTLDWAPTP